MIGGKHDSGPAKPDNPNAARDHLANERTFLAWIRSCIAIVALGFVVARFGLIVKELGARTVHQTPSALSTGFGVALVGCGGLLSLLALLRYRNAGLAIDAGTYRSSFGLILLLSAGFMVTAILLVAYLITTA